VTKLTTLISAAKIHSANKTMEINNVLAGVLITYLQKYFLRHWTYKSWHEVHYEFSCNMQC